VSTDSAIRVRVDAVGEDTTLAGIQRLVAEAQQSRSRTQVLADRAAALLFYVAVGAALITGVVRWIIGDPDDAVVRVVRPSPREAAVRTWACRFVGLHVDGAEPEGVEDDAH
jgi:cation transport ATPase